MTERTTHLLKEAMGWLEIGLWKEAFKVLSHVPRCDRTTIEYLDVRMKAFQTKGDMAGARRVLVTAGKYHPGRPYDVVMYDAFQTAVKLDSDEPLRKTIERFPAEAFDCLVRFWAFTKRDYPKTFGVYLEAMDRDPKFPIIKAVGADKCFEGFRFWYAALDPDTAAKYFCKQLP